VIGKIALGEADVGIVYTTDIAASAGDVDEVAIAPEHNIVATYSIVRLADDDRTHDFVRFVLSDEGRGVLSRAGFGAP
jgi:molybdate transport system substrate-binding protein